MTHKQLKEQGYRLSRLYIAGTRRNRYNWPSKLVGAYFLYHDDKFLGAIKPLKDRPSRWGAHPVLKSDAHSARQQPVSDHKTVPEAAAALIAWKGRGGASRRPSVTCPRCGSTSRVTSSIGGVQNRLCKHGHEFTYDRWMADRIMWAPSAVGSLSRMGSI